MHWSNSGSKTEFGHTQNERPPPPDCHTAGPSQLAKTKTDLGRVSTLRTQCSRLLQSYFEKVKRRCSRMVASI